MEGDCLLAQLKQFSWWSIPFESLQLLLAGLKRRVDPAAAMCEETSSSLFAAASRAYRQREAADGSADLFVPFIWPE